MAVVDLLDTGIDAESDGLEQACEPSVLPVHLTLHQKGETLVEAQLGLLVVAAPRLPAFRWA